MTDLTEKLDGDAQHEEAVRVAREEGRQEQEAINRHRRVMDIAGEVSQAIGALTYATEDAGDLPRAQAAATRAIEKLERAREMIWTLTA